MRTLLLLIPLALISCKPDPIEACVEAKKKKHRVEMCREKDTGDDVCTSKTWELLVTLAEPRWRETCMRAAAGEE
jgi:hypothetical protein